jgi:Protein of unknown function (DUF2442)
MRSTLKSVVVKSYPILHLEFEDGFSGDLDLTETISRGNMFEPLKQRDFFEKVKMDHDGYSFGWHLDNVGNEIDFSADGARIDLETAFVKNLAEEHRSKIQAAE